MPVKNQLLRFRCTKELKDKLQENVKIRTYPGNDDVDKAVTFESESQFLEYITRICCNLNEEQWYLFSRMVYYRK